MLVHRIPSNTPRYALRRLMGTVLVPASDDGEPPCVSIVLLLSLLRRSGVHVVCLLFIRAAVTNYGSVPELDHADIYF